MTRAYDDVTVDVAVGQDAAVVRAAILDHAEASVAKPNDRDERLAVARRRDFAATESPRDLRD